MSFVGQVLRGETDDHQDCQPDDRPTDPGEIDKDCDFKSDDRELSACKTEGSKGGPKDKAEGVAFLGAFLPRLHNCSSEVDILSYIATKLCVSC